MTHLLAVICAVMLVKSSTSLGQTTSSSPSVATSPVAAPSGPPDQAEMMKQMMEMGKLNENHKLLADSAGTWSYIVKFWPAPGAPVQESKGTATRKMIMNGRYLVGDYTGVMPMAGPDGKMKPTTFKGMGLEAYDNVKKKFVATWMDNMGTGIMMIEGTYDDATKTLTSTGEEEMMPGVKTPIREVIKYTDKNHMALEWFETQGGQEFKAMEINYTRAKK